MFKKIVFTLLALALVGHLKAQGLRLVNMSTNADITNTTIEIRSVDNSGFQGYESLQLSVKVVNISDSLMEIGAKKIEEDSLQPDVQNTICFAGGCYAANVFVSPNHIQLVPGAVDSGFVGDYLFDNRVHVRGNNHISYVFYSAAHPSDSAVVHVVYNTLVTTAIEPIITGKQLRLYPNPAINSVGFQDLNLNPALYSLKLLITDMCGKTIALPSLGTTATFDVTGLMGGIYHYCLVSPKEELSNGKLSIIR